MSHLRRLHHVVLAAILLLAAVLRFTGIDHGIRRGEPLADETENFIQPVLGMWDTRSADPNVHAGYPGFFNYVAFLPMGAGRRLVPWNGAALGGRALVAAFATLNVFLLFRLLRPRWGPAAALFGAALLALSRSDVSESHAITPDILVVSAFLAMALSLQATSSRAPWPGVWAGLGVAIKHSGVILLPALVAELAVRRQLRRRLVPLLAAAALALVIAAPYATVFRKAPTETGRTMQYYSAGLQGTDVAAGVVKRAHRALEWTWENLGVLGSILALAGLALARPRRDLVFPAAVLLTTVIVVSTPRALGPHGQVFPRHVLLAGAAATVLAAAGYSVLAKRPPLAIGLAVLALAQPAVRAVGVTAGYARPDELERAATWLESQGRPVRVATPLTTFRVEPPVELRNDLDVGGLPEDALSCFDFVFAPGPDTGGLAGLATAAVFEEPGNPEGRLAVLRPIARPDAAWPAPVESSGSAPGAERAFDRDLATAWTAPAGAGWLEAHWDRPRAVHLIEVIAEAGEDRWPQRLLVLGRTGTEEWAPIDVLALRPMRTRRQNPPHGQVFLVTGERSIDGIRIERGDGRDWGLADVRLSGREP